MTQAIGQIAGNGLLGAMLVIVLYAYWKKDKALGDQSTEFRAQIILLQREVIMAVNKMADLVEAWEKREHERDLQRAREDSSQRGRTGR